MAADLAEDRGYPFTDRDLPRITQYIRNHPIEAKRDHNPHYLVREKLQSGNKEPRWGCHDELHTVIADLPISIFATTNYDDFMLKALKNAGKTPRMVRSYWNKPMQNLLSAPRFRPSDPRELLPTQLLKPDIQNPLVFHMHGMWDEPISMVLTEDDYLEYLTRVGERSVIPLKVHSAFTTDSLLFLGYSLQDIDFKVLFAMIANLARPSIGQHFSVQLAPALGKETPSPEEVDRAEIQRQYLELHYGFKGISFYWASCSAFAEELRRRWQAYEQNGGS